MKPSREIRAEAWRLMWKEGWFGRGLVAVVLLGAVMWAVSAALAFAFRAMEIETLRDFAAAHQQAAAEGLAYSASSNEALMRMTVASMFENFVQYLLGGIMMFGLTALTLRAVREGKRGWFGSALSGFSVPIGMFWLMFNVQIRIAWWILLAAIPLSIVGATGVQMLGVSAEQLPVVLGGFLAVPISLVMFWLVYRYFLVWFLKADHPDWGAWRCIRESISRMDGCKWAAVRLDCSYWLSLLWFLPLGAVLCWLALKAVSGGGMDALAPNELAILYATVVVTVVYSLVVGLYIMLGHAVFYRELSNGNGGKLCDS